MATGKGLVYNVGTGLTEEIDIEILDITVAEVQQSARERIKYSFSQAFLNGYPTVTIQGFLVDCKREDLQNLQSLLSYMNTNAIASTFVRGFNNDVVEVTVTQLESIINELIAYGLWLYQNKWAKETDINNVTQEQFDALKATAISDAQTAIDAANILVQDATATFAIVDAMPRTTDEEIALSVSAMADAQTQMATAQSSLSLANSQMDVVTAMTPNIILDQIIW